VETDDPDTPTSKLTITANIVVEVGFELPSVQFRDMKVGDSSSQKVPVIGKDAASLVLGEAKTEMEGLSARAISEKGPDGTMRHWVEVSYTASTIGNQNGKVLVPTNNPKFPSLELNVWTFVKGDIELSPNRLTMLKTDPNLAKMVALLQGTKSTFAVLSAKDPKGLLNVTVKPRVKGKEYELTVEASPEGKKQTVNFSANIDITTDSKDQPALSLPVFYRVGVAALGKGGLSTGEAGGKSGNSLDLGKVTPLKTAPKPEAH